MKARFDLLMNELRGYLRGDSWEMTQTHYITKEVDDIIKAVQEDRSAVERLLTDAMEEISILKRKAASITRMSQSTTGIRTPDELLAMSSNFEYATNLAKELDAALAEVARLENICTKADEQMCATQQVVEDNIELQEEVTRQKLGWNMMYDQWLEQRNLAIERDYEIINLNARYDAYVDEMSKITYRLSTRNERMRQKMPKVVSTSRYVGGIGYRSYHLVELNYDEWIDFINELNG